MTRLNNGASPGSVQRARPHAPQSTRSPQGSGQHPPAPSTESLRGLDWLNFFVANVQTGFGPFVAVYLTAGKWTQIDIGLMLTISSLFALVIQIPCGIIVDAIPSKRLVAALSAVAISVSAIMLAAWPIFLTVLIAELLHGAASSLIGPAIAAITLGLVGRSHIGERLGRNARFASVGNGIAAAVMGACGRLFSTRAVFIFTALLALLPLLALRHIKAHEIDATRARGGVPVHSGSWRTRLHGLIDSKPLLIFGACLALFHLSNGAMLPLMGSFVTMRSSQWATVLIAACIVVPQILVALFSPWVGRLAEKRGRRPLLIAGFAALVLRGFLFSIVTSPYLVVLVQMLDGISGAVLGVMLPLVVVDASRGTGHFNAALGVVATIAGIGASLSTSLAGYIADTYGRVATFSSLAAIAAVGLGLLYLTMPETRPTDGTGEQ